MKYFKWISRLILWDGLLPCFAFLIPAVARAVFGRQNLIGKNALADVLLIAGVPLGLFILRVVIGQRRLLELAEERDMGWRVGFFLLGLFFLALFEAILILSKLLDAQADGIGLNYSLYGVYFLFVAIAFFPNEAETEHLSENQEKPWATVGESEE